MAAVTGVEYYKTIKSLFVHVDRPPKALHNNRVLQYYTIKATWTQETILLTSAKWFSTASQLIHRAGTNFNH